MFYRSKKEPQEKPRTFSTRKVSIDVKKAKAKVFLSNGDILIIDVYGSAYTQQQKEYIDNETKPFVITVDNRTFKEEELLLLISTQKMTQYFNKISIEKIIVNKKTIKEHHIEIDEWYVS